MIIITDVRMVHLLRCRCRYTVEGIVVCRLFVLMQRELFHRVRLLLLPDEHVVHHRATTENYTQTDEDTGYYRWG